MSYIRGLPNVRRLLKDAPQKLASVIKNEMETVVREAELEAKQNAPVDLGKHRQSIVGEIENNGLTGKLSANMPYSPYLEFGTGAEIDIPSGFEDLAVQFKGQGKKKINLPARPHIIPATTKAAKKLVKNIEKKLENL